MNIADIERWAREFYADRDPQHDWSHIEKLIATAIQEYDLQPEERDRLTLAAYIHGIIKEKEFEIRSILRDSGHSETDVDKIIRFAHESAVESCPETRIGRILHDTHITMEGEYGQSLKCLLTGEDRGSSVRQSIEFLAGVASKWRCYTATGKVELEQILRTTYAFLANYQRNTGTPLSQPGDGE